MRKPSKSKLRAATQVRIEGFREKAVVLTRGPCQSEICWVDTQQIVIVPNSWVRDIAPRIKLEESDGTRAKLPRSGRGVGRVRL